MAINDAECSESVEGQPTAKQTDSCKRNDCLKLLRAVKDCATIENLQALSKALLQDRHAAILCRHHGVIPAVVECWLACEDAAGVAASTAASILRLYAGLHAAAIRRVGVEALCAKALRHQAVDTSADLAPVVALWCKLGTPSIDDALKILQWGSSSSHVSTKRALLKGLLKRKIADLADSFVTQEAQMVLKGFLGTELKEEAMALLCKVVEPIQVPPCNRGGTDEDGEESDSEASEDEVEDDLEEKRSVKNVQPILQQTMPILTGDDAVRHRTSGIDHVCSMAGVEAFGEGSCDIVDCSSSEQALSAQLEEFEEHLAVDASKAEHWPVLFPGRNEEELTFHADFEGGNLRRVRREDGGALEVLLNGDTNRKKHSQWFFFDIETAAPQEIRLHVVSFANQQSTFSQGGRVVLLPPDGVMWERAGYDYSYSSNRYCIGTTRKHRTLAFTLSILPGRSRIAYFYPYLFGDLLRDMRCLRPEGDWLDIQTLGMTPGGRPMLMLKITDFSSLVQAAPIDSSEQSQLDKLEPPEQAPAPRPHIIISARVHPGESPASFMLRGVLELLLSTSEEASELRSRFVFVVLPMLNPDGVALGNGRSNSAGYDLNRCWEDPPEGSEIELAKRELFRCCSSPGGVRAYLDLHAHSRRNGVFTLSNPGGEQLPDILAQSVAGIFDRAQCTFQSEADKRGSARSAVWREMGVTHAHTIESGYAGVPDRSRLLTTQDLVKVGGELVRGCAKLTLDKPKADDAIKKKPAVGRKFTKKRSGGPNFTLVM